MPNTKHKKQCRSSQSTLVQSSMLGLRTIVVGFSENTKNGAMFHENCQKELVLLTEVPLRNTLEIVFISHAICVKQLISQTICVQSR